MRTFSKFFAVVLIVLAVSPVTAPFASSELAALVTDTGHMDTDSKNLKETTTAATFVDASVRLEHGPVVFAVAKFIVAHSCQAAPSILRL